jgi:hypothetical protein
MANMSYCAFENTFLAIDQCIDLLDEAVEGDFNISDNEMVYADRIADRLPKFRRLLEELEAMQAQAASPDGVRR